MGRGGVRYRPTIAQTLWWTSPGSGGVGSECHAAWSMVANMRKNGLCCTDRRGWREGARMAGPARPPTTIWVRGFLTLEKARTSPAFKASVLGRTRRGGSPVRVLPGRDGMRASDARPRASAPAAKIACNLMPPRRPDRSVQQSQAEPLLRRALAIREKALGPDDPHVATTLNNLLPVSMASRAAMPRPNRCSGVLWR